MREKFIRQPVFFRIYLFIYLFIYSVCLLGHKETEKEKLAKRKKGRMAG